LGEIKSTLDIVLEKTKHLKLSEDEKCKEKSKNFEKNLKGLLQKYQDQRLNLQQLKKELNHLTKSVDLSAEKFLIPAVLEQIDIGKDNEPLLVLLDEIYAADIIQLRAVLSDFQNAVRLAAHKKTETLKDNLAQKYSISGSAVLPNLEADDAWSVELESLQSEFQRDLSREKALLANRY
jgi:hypothetical protein